MSIRDSKQGFSPVSFLIAFKNNLGFRPNCSARSTVEGEKNLPSNRKNPIRRFPGRTCKKKRLHFAILEIFQQVHSKLTKPWPLTNATGQNPAYSRGTAS